jgi:Leucine-rich repeat (LRR) protein
LVLFCCGVFSNISFQFLRHINLRDNRLEELNDGILVMDGLEKLNVSQNKLVKLPAPIGSLSGLADLDISYNEIREVPNDFGKLKLKKLGYAGNKLKVLIRNVLCVCVFFIVFIWLKRSILRVENEIFFSLCLFLSSFKDVKDVFVNRKM